mmetsp:Transcript_8514/g.10511  ORF Transcript_8514/g.10511 Transcript_8514/m.10511 type:complete len:116 (-) Transcript_8514:25-372(-)
MLQQLGNNSPEQNTQSTTSSVPMVPVTPSKLESPVTPQVTAPPVTQEESAQPSNASPAVSTTPISSPTVVKDSAPSPTIVVPQGSPMPDLSALKNKQQDLQAQLAALRSRMQSNE